MVDNPNGRIYFEYQFDTTAPKITVTMYPEADMDELISAFESFLKAAGYPLSGVLVIDHGDTDETV